jgi:hypothetical protein
LVVANGCDSSLVAQQTLTAISKDADAIACSVEEHVMFSHASFWSRGSEVWSVTHDAQQAIDHVDASGQLPAYFPEIRERLLSQQAAEGGDEAGVDLIFDLPLETAKRVTGFKHDAVGEPARFDVLELIGGSILGRSKPWWKLW